MDPISSLSNCYVLYQSIKGTIDTIESNRNQFDLLKQKVTEIAEPIDRLKTYAKGQLPCSAAALEGLHRALEKIDVFVHQKRFLRRNSSATGSSVLNAVAELYHAASDKDQFIEFDRMLSSSLQSLNMHITVKILDYTMAATKDAAKAAETSAEIQLTQIDNKLLEWNPNSTSEIIGAGAFSKVCTGKYKKEYVAIKVIRQLEEKDLKLITKEAMIMQFADHPNILKLKAVALAKGLLVMELALCSLSDYLHRPNVLARERSQSLRTAVPTPSLQWKLGLLRDVADAIRYLHSFSILHRDIKSANVLLFHDPATGRTTAKVGDFGLALAVELVSRSAVSMQTAPATNLLGFLGFQQQARAAGTASYMAPELFDRRPGERIAYSEASDVYSLGVLANEVLSEKVPWDGDAREVDVMKWVLHDRLRPQLWAGDGTSGEAASLLKVIGGTDVIGSCWNQRPSQRCTADVFLVACSEAPTTTVTPVPGTQGPLPANTVAAVTVGSAQSNSTAPPTPPVQSTSVTPPPTPPPPTPPPTPSSSRLSFFTASSAVASNRAPSIDDPETTNLKSAFAAEIQVAFPDVCPERTQAYAAALFRETIYDVARLQKQTEALKVGYKSSSDKWFQKVGIHVFDATDMLEGKSTSSLTLSSIARASHGVPVMVAWLKENLPDVALPHKRQHLAETLCANNITCTARLRRLAGREDAVPWLVSMQIDKFDAEDMCAKITAMHAGGASSKLQIPTLPGVVLSPLPQVHYDLEDFMNLLAADLQEMLPDMTDVAARYYSATLFASHINTRRRFLIQLSLKSNKAAWLKSLGWDEFDVADFLDTAEFQGTIVDLRPDPAASKALHGTAPLVQWLTEHLSSLKIPSKRQKYAEALVAKNISTVHRLIVRGGSEAWLVSIGFDKLDAADCVAVLKPLAEQDVWAKARSNKAAAVAAEKDRIAAETRKAREECYTSCWSSITECCTACDRGTAQCCNSCYAGATQCSEACYSGSAQCFESSYVRTGQCCTACYERTGQCCTACCEGTGRCLESCCKGTSECFDTAKECCSWCARNHYPCRYWIPDGYEGSDPTHQFERDHYSDFAICCCMIMSPLALDGFLCGVSNCGSDKDIPLAGEVALRLCLCPCMYIFGITLCIGELTCDNVGFKTIDFINHCFKRD